MPSGGVGIFCAIGHTKVQTGYSGDDICYKCEKNVSVACLSGYAKDVDNCGTTGSLGYTLGTQQDSAGCYKCVAKSCPTRSSTATPFCTVGNTVQTVGYSGNQACKKCVSSSVPSCCFSTASMNVNKYYWNNTCYSVKCAACQLCPTFVE